MVGVALKGSSRSLGCLFVPAETEFRLKAPTLDRWVGRDELLDLDFDEL